MIANLTAKGRHLTVIIDLHIKATNSYFVHNDCIEHDYYTKNKDGGVYEGALIKLAKISLASISNFAVCMIDYFQISARFYLITKI